MQQPTVFLFALFLVSSIDAARLVFSTSASLSADHVNYSADKTQRCYSLSCFNNEAAFVSWEDLDDGDQLVFYDDENCKGSFIQGKKKSSWAIEFSTYNFKAKTSSFMIWQYATYPLNGIVDICKEKTILTTGNASSSSSKAEAGVEVA
ncbi:hypothetical protein V7S43_015679 [Phytophthora oleae]|uniref:Uncharacterized protein n=1 Tax=Phytophthora oleae TaxID=2107226 RepID=A0ABD3EY77_9STRA